MNYLETWAHVPFAKALGWSLIHFLWEGVLLALLLAAVLFFCRRGSARLRYALCCLALTAMVTGFALTVVLSLPQHRAVGPATPARRRLCGIQRLAGAAPSPVRTHATLETRGLAGIVPGGCARRHGILAPGDPDADGTAGRPFDRPTGIDPHPRTGAHPTVGLRGQPAAEPGGRAAVLSPGRLVGLRAGSRRT